MNIIIEVKGTSPLLMHNPRMVDPEFDLNRQIKALTAKRKKTDEDLKNIEALEWHGGLYEDNGVIVQPTSNWYLGNHRFPPTHWRPLPEPPHEDAER